MRVVPTDNIIFTVDDYSPENIRLAQLFLEYHLPAVFLIELVPQYDRTQTQEADDQIKQLHALGFEIGGHTQTHPQDMKLLNKDELYDEIVEAKQYVEGLIKEPLYWFAYPRGRYNQTVKDAVREAGFKYARTTSLNLIDNSVPDDYAIEGNIHVYPRKEYDDEDWLDMAKTYFTAYHSIHVWLHGWELTKFNQWQKFEELLKYLK